MSSIGNGAAPISAQARTAQAKAAIWSCAGIVAVLLVPVAALGMVCGCAEMVRAVFFG